MWTRDHPDGLFTDEDFAARYPVDGRPGRSPARLALVSVLQYAEVLTTSRPQRRFGVIRTGNYCLSLEWDDPGFDILRAE